MPATAAKPNEWSDRIRVIVDDKSTLPMYKVLALTELYFAHGKKWDTAAVARILIAIEIIAKEYLMKESV